jgi:hypothetical protein
MERITYLFSCQCVKQARILLYNIKNNLEFFEDQEWENRTISKNREETHRADRVISSTSFSLVLLYSTMPLSKLPLFKPLPTHHTSHQPPSPPQRQYLLRQHRLPTQRTLGLLPHPILDAAPAEDVAAGRDAGVAERLETQRAFALLACGDPG